VLDLHRGREALNRGRLADARAAFLRAADSEDPVVRAEAAIGAGGLWLYEQRVVDDRAAYLALVRRALNGLGGERLDLRLRLRARLAAEATYDGGGTVDDLLAIVDDIRALGDPKALAESLSLLHHAMLTPRYARARLDIANELVAVTAEHHDRTLGMMGLLWRAVDLFLLGDPIAERALSDLRLRAEQREFLVGRYVVGAIDTMLLIRAGRLVEAEDAAAACLRLATEAGDADADGWFMGHVFAIRWLQGRGSELLPLAEQVARGTLLVETFALYMWAIASLLACESGDFVAGRVALDRVLAAGLDALPESSVWLPAMFAIAECASHLDDAETAREVDTRLAPYAALPVMGSLAVVCFGSTTRALGLVQRTAGSLDRAVERLEQALVENRRLGHLPMTAITYADLAETLRRRGDADDLDRARESLDRAIETGTAIGLDARVATWTQQRADFEVFAGTVVRHGTVYAFDAGNESATVPDSVGMRYLLALLTHPGEDLAAGDLAGVVNESGSQPILDDRARREFQRRVVEIESELDDADRAADIERSSRLRAELDALLEELERMVRPGGRSRTFVNADERARTSVQKALRRALAGIATSAPHLADGLQQSIHTGTTCRFDPVPTVPTRWNVR
jgi:tetratricopeptide (TPR) repeat protein